MLSYMMCWIEPPWELLRDGRKGKSVNAEPRRATQHLCYKTAPCRWDGSDLGWALSKSNYEAGRQAGLSF